MTSGKPMDRLVCGDVGFGKTEVALRAAFVAVLGGKQVAILAPTTLLAEQHAQTFADRFADWRSEEHTSELQSLMRISYAVFCLKKKQECHKKTILTQLKLKHNCTNTTNY